MITKPEVPNKRIERRSQLSIWIGPLVILLLIFAIWLLITCGVLQLTDDNKAQAALVTLTGVSVLVALAQAIQSSQQAEKASTQAAQLQKKDILFSLYEIYVRHDMHRAIDDIWDILQQDGKGVKAIPDLLENPDRYQFLRNYLDAQISERRRELDENRRIVTHFWYLIANLLAQGMLQKEEVFEWFGNPEVIWILEGLEVIKQHTDVTTATKTQWPPLLVLNKYYESKGIDTKSLEKGLIPLARIDKAIVDQIRKL